MDKRQQTRANRLTSLAILVNGWRDEALRLQGTGDPTAYENALCQTHAALAKYDAACLLVGR